MDLWREASLDIEAEHRALRMAQAKIAVAGLWPFLSLAQSEGEFNHRLALAEDRIVEQVPVDLLRPVVASLRDDFQAISTSGWPLCVDCGKPVSPVEVAMGGTDGPKHTKCIEKTGAQEEEAEEAEEDDDKPEWLKKKIQGEGAYFHQGRREWVRPTTPHTASYFHQGRSEWVHVGAVDQGGGGGNPYYFTGGPEAGPNTGQTNQFPPHPTNGDPLDPINQMFPMEPSPWTVPPDKAWRENPMQFNPPAGPNAQRSAVQRHATEGIVPTPGPNPGYFAGGAEGVAGDQQTGFPQDPQGVEPVEDLINELYGRVPISSGVDSGHQARRRAATEHHPAPDSDPLQGTELDSPEERERWRDAQNGEEPGNRDSSPAGASVTASKRTNLFFDPSDPRVRMVAATDPFGEDNPFGSGDNSNAPAGATPQTTPPRQVPGGGGPGMDPAGADATALGGQQTESDRAAQQVQQMLGQTTAADQSYMRPGDEDPTGVQDEYDHNTWEGPLSTRPRQSAEHRRVNTPQTAKDPIPTVGSPQPEFGDDEDDRRQASLVAAQVVRELVLA